MCWVLVMYDCLNWEMDRGVNWIEGVICFNDIIVVECEFYGKMNKLKSLF